MGLIKAAFGALGGTLADQWKEFFYCDSLDSDTLMVRGQKSSNKRSSNTKGSENVITSGSGIVVADGQCMIIVEQGKVVEVCAEPGQFTYDASTEPSIFSGSFGESLKETFKPEFLNRVDDIIIFHQLNKDDTRQIAKILIRSLAKRIAENGIQMQISEGALDFLAEKGYDKEYGARPLKRTIQRYLEDKLSEEILKGSVAKGQKVYVDSDGTQLTFTNKQ